MGSPYHPMRQPGKEISANPRTLACRGSCSVIDYYYYTIPPLLFLRPSLTSPIANFNSPKPDRPVSEGLSFPDPCCPAREKVTSPAQSPPDCSNELPAIRTQIPKDSGTNLRRPVVAVGGSLHIRLCSPLLCFASPHSLSVKGNKTPSLCLLGTDATINPILFLYKRPIASTTD